MYEYIYIYSTLKCVCVLFGEELNVNVPQMGLKDDVEMDYYGLGS